MNLLIMKKVNKLSRTYNRLGIFKQTQQIHRNLTMQRYPPPPPPHPSPVIQVVPGLHYISANQTNRYRPVLTGACSTEECTITI